MLHGIEATPAPAVTGRSPGFAVYRHDAPPGIACLHRLVLFGAGPSRDRPLCRGLLDDVYLHGLAVPFRLDQQALGEQPLEARCRRLLPVCLTVILTLSLLLFP